MTGDYLCNLNRGIIPRSIDQILEYSMELNNQGWEYTLSVSFLEIYNETIRDLLEINNKNKLEIRYDNTIHQTKVLGATIINVSDAEQIHSLLALADKNRSVAATNSNAVSSRSHSVFTIYIKGINKEYNTMIHGSLSMCDLAGSERLNKSGATGDRLKETQAINKSLSSLADVFSALHKKNNHIPFRNSKLTYLLQGSFNKQHGKTLMIVNLSNDSEDKDESLCSLRFAKQVNATELGKAKKQIQSLKKPPSSRSSSIYTR